MQKNYYDILEVSQNASIETIKAAYRSLAKKYHADNGNADVELMTAINEAYEVLSDEDKKAEYDRKLKGGFSQEYRKSASKDDDEVSVELFSRKITFSENKLKEYHLHTIFIDYVMNPIIQKFGEIVKDEVNNYESKIKTLDVLMEFYPKMKEEMMSSSTRISEKFGVDSEIMFSLDKEIAWDNLKQAYYDLIEESCDIIEMVRYESETIYTKKTVDAFKFRLKRVLLSYVCALETVVRYALIGERISIDEFEELVESCESSIETIENDDSIDGIIRAFRYNPFNSLVYERILKNYPDECPALYKFLKENGFLEYKEFGALKVIYTPSTRYKELNPRIKDSYECSFDDALDLLIVEKITMFAGTTNAKSIGNSKLDKIMDLVKEYCLKYDKSEEHICSKMPFIDAAMNQRTERSDFGKRIEEMRGKNLDAVLTFVVEEKGKHGEHIWGTYETELTELINNSANQEMEEKYIVVNKEDVDELKALREILKQRYARYVSSKDYIDKVTADIIKNQEKQVEMIISDIDVKTPVELLEVLENIRNEMEREIYDKYADKFLDIIEKKVEVKICELYERTDKTSIESLQESLYIIRKEYGNYHCSGNYIAEIEKRILAIKEEALKKEIEQLPFKNSTEIDSFMQTLKRNEKVLIDKYQSKCQQILLEKQREELDLLYAEINKDDIDELQGFLNRIKREYKNCQALEEYCNKVSQDIYKMQKAKLYAEIGDHIDESLNTNQAMAVYKKIESFDCPKTIKDEAYNQVSLQLTSNNAKIINSITDKIREIYPFTNSETSKFIFYKRTTEKTGVQMTSGIERIMIGLVKAGIKLEQPILSHLRDGFLDLSSQLNGFSITQKSLLYYEKDMINRIALEDISDFIIQKKLMSTDVFVVTVSGMSVKLPTKFPKEIINNVPIVLKETVRMIRESSL